MLHGPAAGETNFDDDDCWIKSTHSLDHPAQHNNSKHRGGSSCTARATPGISSGRDGAPAGSSTRWGWRRRQRRRRRRIIATTTTTISTTTVRRRDRVFIRPHPCEQSPQTASTSQCSHHAHSWYGYPHPHAASSPSVPSALPRPLIPASPMASWLALAAPMLRSLGARLRAMLAGGAGRKA